MTQREQFKAWIAEYRKGKPYWSEAREQILWDGWKAAHTAALESAIQQLLAISARQTTLSGSVAAHDCIEAVQKLKNAGEGHHDCPR